MPRLLLLFLAVLASCLAQPAVEVGEINGAAFRIDKPEAWNGVLVIYCHGYSDSVGKFDAAKPDRIAGILATQGFAVAQSGYSAGGWAVAEAMQDTEALRRYFLRKHGTPKETYITGHSMGGLLTAATLETYPNAYDGGLAMCGALGPAHWGLLRHYFEVRVVFDVYFPGALPSPAGSTGGTAPLLKLLDEKPDAAAALRRYAGTQNNQQLAMFLAFNTKLLAELNKHAGGNPFDNRNTVYVDTGDDNMVNDKVARYTADPRAAAYVRRYFTTTGRLQAPLLAVHNTYDPIVPAWIPNQYQVLTESAGTTNLFVQQYVKHDGHCNISPAETTRAFNELLDWKRNGKRPESGELK